MAAPYSKYASAVWGIAETAEGRVTENQATLCVLMDIRGELQKLNRVLHCTNFLDIPFKLDWISKKLTKKRRKPAKKHT
jgi:hypothetical protein